MYFAEATKLLGAGRYEDALRLLKRIESDYPFCRFISQVKEFVARLEGGRFSVTDAQSADIHRREPTGSRPGLVRPPAREGTN
jgi:hypothetical protein